MRFCTKKISLFWILLISLIGPISQADEKSKEQITTAYLYNFAKNIEWPRENYLSNFKIAGFNLKNRRLVEELKLLCKTTTLRKLPIQFESVSDSNKLSQYQMVVVGKADESQMQKIYEGIGNSLTLVITFDFDKKELVMINLFESTGKTITFEVNRANIINQGLKPLAKLIFHGGSEIDVAKLYEEGQASIRILQSKLRAREDKLETLTTNIEVQQLKLLKVAEAMVKTRVNIENTEAENKKLEQKFTGLEKTIAKSSETITEQESEIKKQLTEIAKDKLERDKLLADIKQQKKELQLQADRINTQQKRFKDQEEKYKLQKLVQIKEMDDLKANISDQKKELAVREERQKEIQIKIDKGMAQLDNLRGKITTQEKQLATSNQKIDEQGGVIATQKKSLRTQQIAIFLASILVLTIVLAYYNKRRDNKMLKKQRVELQTTLDELKLTQDQLVLAKEDAIKASQAKSEFLANMSHEIRTPMNAILGFSEVLKHQELNDKCRGYVDSIHSSGKSLLRLINDILDLSKVEAGKFELQYAPVQPYELFSGFQQIFAEKVRAQNIEFLIDIDSKLPRALILDETRIRQVLFNLIGNAIKFTDKGYVKLSVREEITESDGSRIDLLFSVEDTGVGIPEQEQQSVFGAFEQMQGQSQARYGGTGLGLAISQKLVKLMDGEISLQSEVGSGTVFNVILRNVEIGAGLPFMPNANSLPQYNFEDATILITDDVETNRLLLATYLDNFNFNLLFAQNGEEAIEVATEFNPDLILMDIKMPVMDGFTATKILKSNSKTKDIPIIIVTASAMKDTQEKLTEIAEGYMTKPVSRQGLLDTLAKFISYNYQEVNVKDNNQTIIIDTPPEELLELLTLLQGETYTCWQDLNLRPVFNTATSFANQLLKDTAQFHYPPISTWGERVISSSNSFNPSELKKSLDQFEPLLEELAKLTKQV